eukprot:1515187-Prymnesium_polylepis.1
MAIPAVLLQADGRMVWSRCRIARILAAAAASGFGHETDVRWSASSSPTSGAVCSGQHSTRGSAPT